MGTMVQQLNFKVETKLLWSLTKEFLGMPNLPGSLTLVFPRQFKVFELLKTQVGGYCEENFA
jgi:hypothetical protein